MKRRILVVAGIGLLAILAAAVAVVWSVGKRVPQDDPQSRATVDSELPVFPELVGTNLLLNEVRIPEELDSGPRLIVVAYDVDQQPDVDSWLEPLETLNEVYPELSGYYVPLLPKSAADGALFIIGGMSLAAGSDVNRERTIVVFTDIADFNRLVDVPDTNEIRLYLLDEVTQIRWEETGPFTEEKATALEATLVSLME